MRDSIIIKAAAPLLGPDLLHIFVVLTDNSLNLKKLLAVILSVLKRYLIKKVTLNKCGNGLAVR